MKLGVTNRRHKVRLAYRDATSIGSMKTRTPLRRQQCAGCSEAEILKN